MTLTVAPVTTAPRRYQFSVEQFHQLAREGILAEDDRLELFDGEIIEMSPIGADHADCVDRLTELLGSPEVRRIARLRIQNPVVLGPKSELYPDVSLARRESGSRPRQNPTADQVFLLIEVSDSTLVYDRDVKIPRYAREGIPESWLIDLPNDRVIVFREPSADGYKQERTYRRGDALSSAAFPGLAIDVAEILG